MSYVGRVYLPDECGADGYPYEWHGDPGRDNGIKHIVRAEADWRCIRCGHPYNPDTAGSLGEWSRCDDVCDHAGPLRIRVRDGSWQMVDPGPAWTGGNQTIEAQWRILTVHHLTLIKLDCRWWNLVALCQKCHLTIQRRVVMRQVYPFKHSDWFMPYAAAYYAHVYLDEELTREQTMGRLEELLALERIA